MKMVALMAVVLMVPVVGALAEGDAKQSEPSSVSESSVEVQQRCTKCAGSGTCTGMGTAGKWRCHGSGKCVKCNGKGYN